MLSDADGNAVDSVVGAFAAYRHVVTEISTSEAPDRTVEGHVSVCVYGAVFR